jgi:CAAX prenyl protease-like protein
MYAPTQISAAWSRILPYAIYLVFLALEQLLAPQGAVGWAGVDVRWLYPAKAVTVALALLWLWPRYEELRQRPRWAPALLAVAAGIGVWWLWISLDHGWVTLGESQGFDPRATDGHIVMTLAAFRMFGAVLVVPVMEELFWRSFIMRRLSNQEFLAVTPSSVRLTSLLLTALLFGFQHHLWLAGIIAGIVYGGLFVRTGNLWVPIIAHAVTNGALGVWVLASGQWRFW